MTAASFKHIVRCVKQNPEYGYDGRIQDIRRTEYAHMGDTIYFDHAGATIYPSSIVRDHCHDLSANLYSNPHSHSLSSITTGIRIDAVRQQVLKAFNADPEFFDIVFVANATAGIKLIADGFSGSPSGFRYRYLRDAHSSLVGVCGLAREHDTLSEEEVKMWLGDSVQKGDMPGLFAYPAQSNLTGRRFPLEWISELRESRPGWYSLLDASSYLTTTPLDYSDVTLAPDFTVLSFYKIFGYPDLGGLIVRKDAGHMLTQRRFFGGGTRAALTVNSWNIPHEVLHEALEDGTLPFHTILALEVAFKRYNLLFGAHIFVARHTALVTRLAYTLLLALRYENGQPVCKIYSTPNHGPIIAFNLLASNGTPISFNTFEKLASLRKFAIRTGGMCNPGGVQQCMGLQTSEMEDMFENGKVCGDDKDIIDGVNVGVIRVSFGATSTVEEVCAFIDFLEEFCIGMRKKLVIWTGQRRSRQ